MQNSSRKEVLLITYSLFQTGAPIAILNVAIALKNMGYIPIVISNQDGPLKNNILERDIAVILEPGLLKNKSVFESWVSKYDIVFINTIVYYSMIKKCNFNNSKVIWWVHEAEDYYNIICDKKEKVYIPANIDIYGVGNVACNNFNKYFGRMPKNLLYGIGEDIHVEREKKGDKTIFAIIGSIITRKGHDILLDSLQYISDSYWDKAELWIIGSKDDNNMDLYNRMCNVASQKQYVKIKGEKTRYEMKEIYKYVDVLLAPSREDPMPITITEAMINAIPAIVSDGCGTAGLLKNGFNGLIFRNENAKELAEKIKYAIDNPDRMIEMGIQVRNIFEQKFSIMALEKNVNMIINGEY